MEHMTIGVDDTNDRDRDRPKLVRRFETTCVDTITRHSQNVGIDSLSAI
jgi:hypothetical protein